MVKTAFIIDTETLAPKTEKLMADLDHRIARWLKRSATEIGEAIRKRYGASTVLKLAKFDENTPDATDPYEQPEDQTELLAGGKKIPKVESDAIRALVLLTFSKLPWASLDAEVYQYLEAAGEQGIDIGLEDLGDGLGDAEPVSVAEQKGLYGPALEAVQRYSGMRSAEMVGMKRDADGNLVANPDAEWAISETTRMDLKRTITQAVEEGWTADQLAAVIEASYTFSTARSAVIARTEMARAQSLGTYTVWQMSEVTVMVQWVTSADEGVCDICDSFEDQGVVLLGHEFAPGIQYPTAHPNCRCALEAVKDGNA